MATPGLNDTVVQNILRIYARNKLRYQPGGVDDDPEKLKLSLEEAWRSLQTLFEQAAPGGVPDLRHLDIINEWIKDAPVIFKDDLGYGQAVEPYDPLGGTYPLTPTPAVVTDPSQMGPTEPASVFGTTGETEDEARARFEIQRAGRQQTFRDYIGQQLNPGASPFLRAGLESRFTPLNLMFETREALGENLTDPITRGSRSFRDWLGTYIQPGGSTFGESRPSVRAFQGLANRALGALQGGFGAGTGGVAQRYLEDPENQFQLALQSRLGSVAPFLRENFAATARDRFNRFMVQNPGRAGEYLAEFMGPQGGRF